MLGRYLLLATIIFSINCFVAFESGCSPEHSTAQNNEQKAEVDAEAIEPIKVVYEYPYNEDGQFIFESDKEFHQKDCVGYRSHYGIGKSVLPCESDDDLQFYIFDRISKDMSDVELYTGHRRVDSETIEYSTKITLATWFLSEHKSSTTISIEGVTTRNVLTAESMSIFLWDYQSRSWKNTPEIFVCDSYSKEHVYDDEKESYIVSLGCSYWEESSVKMNAILHNEEVFQVRMTTWEADEVRDGSFLVEKKRAYSIPTPTFRKDMHKAWRYR